MDVDRLAAGAGVVGPLVGFAATLSATVLSPSFRWTASALSDLGAPGAANPWLFNWGLVASAAVTVVFVWVLWTDAANRIEQLGAVLFVGTNAGLALVGLFPSGTDLHFPVAVAYFVLLTFTLWIHGSGWVLGGAPASGLIAIWLGIGHVLLWIGWLAAGLGGIAVPEFGGSLALYAWVLLAIRTAGIPLR